MRIMEDVQANCIQFPIKLDYSTTVDKAQGRTISSLIVDCYNFWKPAQMGVAVRRSTCKDGLQIQNYNSVSYTNKLYFGVYAWHVGSRLLLCSCCTVVK